MDSKIIIVEGIDGAGKTTLINKISNLLNVNNQEYTVVHKTQPKLNGYEEYIKPLKDLKNILVADRWHVSETIYGPIYRGKSLLDDNMVNYFESLLNVIGAVKIVVAPPADIVFDRMKKRGEDFLQDEDFNKIYNEYLKYALKYDYIIANDDTNIQLLLEQKNVLFAKELNNA